MDVSRSSAFVNAIAAAQAPAEIGSCLVQVAKAFGFSSVYGGLVPRGRTSRKAIAPLTLVQHVPKEWGERYNERGYLFRDPVFRRLQVDAQPFTWRDSYSSCPSEADRKLVGGEAAVYGLKDGFVVPIITLEERVAAVSFGGDRATLDPDEASKLSFVVNYAVGRFLALHDSEDRSPARLTPRERECLLWSSEGKTEADIGDILGVSTSTISKHIAAARDKLQTVNKAHAVAMAMKLKIF